MISRSPEVQAALERLYIAVGDMKYVYAHAWIVADPNRIHAAVRPLIVATGQLMQSVLDDGPSEAPLDAVLAAARAIRPASRRVLIEKVYDAEMPDAPEIAKIYERLVALLSALNHESVE